MTDTSNEAINTIAVDLCARWDDKWALLDHRIRAAKALRLLANERTQLKSNLSSECLENVRLRDRISELTEKLEEYKAFNDELQFAAGAMDVCFERVVKQRAALREALSGLLSFSASEHFSTLALAVARNNARRLLDGGVEK